MSSFYQPAKYNGDTKTQMWMSAIGDMHDCFCGCTTPFAHLLDNIFPEGHKDRNKPVSYIIKRDYTQCHSGGDAVESAGMADAGPSDAAIKEEGYIEDEELDQLIGLGESAAAEEQR